MAQLCQNTKNRDQDSDDEVMDYLNAALQNLQEVARKEPKRAKLKIWELGQLILNDIWTVCHFADNTPIQSECFMNDYENSSSTSNES